ncbi:MAG: asparagine synthase (glutamine-hydrolyzing) [Deltaproteobacteria bacterium]|nr:asparagine synthase (glutamine-hydrolyzing) [Deltaproteobacteria bacterium]
MCGICGFAGAGDRDILASMNDAMVHRGPDAGGLWNDTQEAVYLGHRRLSIIDLSGGAQPMWTVDGALGIVFNGEIYNHLELREELVKVGHRFLSDHSDTEVLLHGYRQWGRELPSRLNGMWAFALYDRSRRELFLSRDRFGKKPLFYSLQNRTFVFASELSALILHPQVTAGIHAGSLKKYFAYGYIPAPSTLYKQVFKLPGGHNLMLQLDTMTCRVSKYWDFVLEPFEDVPVHPEESWGEELRDLLRKSVRRRLMSDVPLGVFLSGGIDSSAVTAFAAEAAGQARMKSFCIGFEEASFDETTYARSIAGRYHTEHCEEVLSMERARGLLPEIVGKLDEPMGDSSLVPTYLLCRETRKHVTVALSGDGGDELFAGYDPFRALGMAAWYDRLIPGPLHRGIRMAVAALPSTHRNMSLDFRLKRTLRGLSYPRRLWNSVWLGPLDPLDLEALFREPTDIEEVYSEAIEQWDACRQENLIDKTLQFYTKLYLQDDILVKADRASMMNSLEVRAPFLDIDLVDFVRKIPHAYKYRNGQTKYILKKALEPVLPREILYRTKKGFGVPIGRWFQEGSLSFDGQGLFSNLHAPYIAKMVSEHRACREDHRAFLWNVWLLNSWSKA